jgi:hypothetical protein
VSARVYLAGTDLLVRARVAALVTRAGGSLTRESTACDLAILDAEKPGALERIRAFVAAGVSVLAYAPHVQADLLRAARDAGATAVPNSELERRLAVLLTSPASKPAPRSDADEPSLPSEG